MIVFNIILVNLIFYTLKSNIDWELKIAIVMWLILTIVLTIFIIYEAVLNVYYIIEKLDRSRFNSIY